MNTSRTGLLVLMVIGAVCAVPRGTFAADAAAANPAVEGNTAFACEMYAQLIKDEKGNLFFSPASIHTALAMTYAGAKGDTAAQMAKALHYPEDPKALAGSYAAVLKMINTPPLDHEKKPVYELVVANALWGRPDYPFLPEFLALNKESYGAGLNAVDFAQSEAARKTINDWVAQQTKDRIKDLIPQGILDALTRLVLTNAVYFKSSWAEEFSEHATKDDAFVKLDGQQVQVPMMKQTKRFGYFEDADVQVLELPYNRRELNMVVILPRKVDGLPSVEKSLSGKQLMTWLGGLANSAVNVALPKYKIESQFKLADALQALGMTDAFSDSKANFTGIATAEKLYISAVLHKAFVEVNEKGTEAAAATAVVIRTKGVFEPPADPKVFKADHPFMFLIRHRATGEILFLGRVMEPAK
jgi:serpin B